MMYPDAMESAFSEFLESKDYDGGAEALFTLTRQAFLAGWRAAQVPGPQG